MERALPAGVIGGAGGDGRNTTGQAATGDLPATGRHAPVGVRFKLTYGSGALIDGVVTAALTYFLLFYLTSVCGMSGTAAGTALLIGLLLDAAVDPLIGLVSDNLRSRLGRRLPLMIAGAGPLALCFALLFSIPAGLSGTPLLIYACVIGAMLRVSLSLFVLPFMAVGAEVTDDYQDRSSIVGYRILFTILGTLLGVVLGLGVFMSGAEGLRDRAAYLGFGWTVAALILSAALLASLATRSVLARLHSAQVSERSLVRRYVADFRDMFRNRTFVILFIASLAFFVGQGMAGALTLYVNRYFWMLSTAQVQLTFLGGAVGPLVGAPVTALLTRRFEKKHLAIANFLLFVLTQAWPPLARIAGLLPWSGSSIVLILIGNALVGGAALVGAAICAQSMMGDATDEHEHRFGVRREGLFFAGLTLAVKTASGLGGFLAGVALDLVHFPTGAAEKAANLRLSSAVLRDLGIIGGPVPAAVTLLAVAALIFHTLSRARHAEMLAALGERRATLGARNVS